MSYQYAVTIDTDASDQYAVICSLPADSQGVVYPDIVSLMSVSGDVVISESSTPYGVGLEVIGNGSAVMTWSFYYHYRTSTESVLDHYSNLSMLDFGYYLTGGKAFVCSDGVDVNISLAYSYSHVYGNVGADYRDYRIVGHLTDGWNEFPVNLISTVS